jgi:hypothetical protein
VSLHVHSSRVRARRPSAGGPAETTLRSVLATPFRAAVVVAVLALTLGGCRALLEPTPSPTPVDFVGIANELAQRGIAIGNVLSGDAGCSNPNLIPTAISFTASGLDQRQSVKVYLYIFSSHDAYSRRRPDVDACARAYVTDASTYEAVDAAPYVASGQGPWGQQFTDQLRAALEAAAGAVR